MNGGVGSYNDWAYHSSSSSNLSAFALPFSVNRSTPNDLSAPFVNFAESAHAIPSNHIPVHSGSYGYDFFSNPVRELDSTPSSKSYGYSVLQLVDPPNTQLPPFNSLALASNDKFDYDQCSGSIKSSLVEAQPYYPSYNSPPILDGSSSVAHNHWSPSSPLATLDGSSLSDHEKKPSEIGFSRQWAGLWNQFPEFNHFKSQQVEVGSSSCSKEANVNDLIAEENRMNQGCQDVKGSNHGEVLHSSNVMGWEKHSVPFNANHLDENACWWKTAKSVPFNFSSTSVQASPPVCLETHYEAPVKPTVDLGNQNHQLSYSSYDRHLRQLDKTSWVNAGSSASVTGLVKDLNVGGDTAKGDLGGNDFSNMSEAYTLPSSGRASCFDFGPLCMHLERNEANNASDKSVSKDVMDYVFKAGREFQNPHIGLDNLSLRLSTNEGSVEKPFDTVGRCNAAVDSPCWKGAPVADFSPFEAFEAPCSEYVKKTEECLGFLQGPKNFILDTENKVKISCENLNNSRIGHQEKGFSDCPRKFLASDFAPDECNSDGAMNAEANQSKPSGDCRLLHVDDISEMRENSMSPNKTNYDCESRSSKTEKEVVEENKFMSQKQHTLYRDCADTGTGVNECLEYGTSHAEECGLPFPSSVVNAPTSTKLENSDGKVSTPKINIQMLVGTMHNLSELLLFHCLSDTCELKEDDRNVLKNVISNLKTCALKNAEQRIPGKECLLSEPDTSKCVRESRELQQNTSFKGPNLTKVGPEGSGIKCEKQPIHFVSGDQGGNISHSFPPMGDAEMMKDDKMTKALKRILCENFHEEEGAEPQTLLYKNLWLEAEAALCSGNFRARYNQMKIEMEKYSFKPRDDSLDMEEQSKAVVIPNISASQSSATKVKGGHNQNYSAQDLPILSAHNLQEQPCFKFSPDLNRCNTLAPEGKVTENTDSPILGSTISGTNTEAKNFEASDLASSQILKYQFDSRIDTANLEELSSLDTANKLVSGGKDSKIQVDFSQDSSFPGKNKDNDFEASVMARFQILKSRVEDLSSMSSDGQLIDGVGFVGKGSDSTNTKNAIEGESMDVNINPVMMHVSSYTAVDKSIPKEFHLNLEYDQEIQPYGTYRSSDQLPTYYSDGFSSEWEHIKKEELAGQTLKPKELV